MKHLLWLLATLLITQQSFSHEHKRFRCMEWNCENLFDTCHDEGKDDHQFLPDGENQWNTPRYWKKQSALAHVILDAAGLQPIDLIALCEIENDTVLRDLTQHTRLAALGYKYTLTQSQDQRGIDVALLYQPTTFRLITSHAHNIKYNPETERPTRDILHTTGIIPTGDTLDIITVHFPSRRGGEKATKPYRIRAAQTINALTDSIKQHRQAPAIIIMGDCNDQPNDQSIQTLVKNGFINISAQAKAQTNNTQQKQNNNIKGTYYFQGEWNRIDNILVTPTCTQKYKATQAFIFAPNYLLEGEQQNNQHPYRTYQGTRYHGGYSDHLPLCLDLWY